MGNKQYVGGTYSGPIDQSPTTPVFNLVTVNVVRSGIVNASGLDVINIISGFSVLIDVTTLVKTQTLVLLATGGVAAKVSLSNGGTIAGQNVYTLNPGTVLTVNFDGTNFN